MSFFNNKSLRLSHKHKRSPEEWVSVAVSFPNNLQLFKSRLTQRLAPVHFEVCAYLPDRIFLKTPPSALLFPGPAPASAMPERSNGFSILTFLPACFASNRNPSGHPLKMKSYCKLFCFLKTRLAD